MPDKDSEQEAAPPGHAAGGPEHPPPPAPPAGPPVPGVRDELELEPPDQLASRAADELQTPRGLPEGTMRPSDAIVLTGILGSSSRAGHRRLYLDEELKEHVEIPDGDLRHLEWVEGDRSVFGRRATLWIRRDATLDYTTGRR